MILTFYFVDVISGWKKLGANIIKGVEDIDFSHFAVGFFDGEEEVVYEAVFPYSQKLSKEEWIKHYKIIHEFRYDIPESKCLDVENFLETMVGKFYGVDQIVFIAFSIWFNIKKRFAQKALFNYDNRIICTELGYLFCKNFIQGYWNIDQDRVDLRDMYLIALRLDQVMVWL
jgi:hypothetical protein